MAVIATAEVRVVADTSRFLSNLRRQLRGAFGQVGAGAAEQFTREFGNNLSDDLTAALRASTQQATRGMRQAGASAAEQFTTGFSDSVGRISTEALEAIRSQVVIQAAIVQGGETADGFINGLRDRLDQQLGGQVRDALLTPLDSIPSIFHRTGTEAAQALSDGMGTAFAGTSTIGDAVDEVLNGIDRRFAEAAQRARQNGGNLMANFAAGIARGRAQITAEAEAAAEAMATAFNEALDPGRPQFLVDFLAGIESRQAQLNLGMRRSGIDAFNAFRGGVADAQQRLGTGVNPIRMRRDGEEAADGLLTGFRRRMGGAAARISLRFARNLRTNLVGAASVTGRRFGQAFENSLTNRARSAGNAFIRAVRRAFRGAEDEAAESGRRAGSRFSRGLRGGIRGLGKALSSISLGPLQGLAGILRSATSEMFSMGAQMLVVIGLLEAMSGILFALPAAVAVLGAGIATAAVAFQGFGSAISASFEDLESFNEAIQDLAPAAQSVAREFRAITPALESLQLDVQNALFAQLDGIITDIAANLLGPLQQGMTTAGSALGVLVGQFGEFFAQSATADTVSATFAVLSELFLAASESIQPLLAGMRVLVDTFLPRIAELAGPLSTMGEQFAAWAKSVTESGAAMESFNLALDTFSELGSIVADLGGIFQAMFSAAQLAGVDALGAIGEALQVIRTTFESFEGQVALANVFAAISNAVTALAPVFATLITQLGLVFPIIGQIAQALGPSLSVVLEGLGQALLALGPGVVEVFSGIATAAEAIAPALAPLGSALGTLLSAVAPLLPVIGELVAVVVELGAQIIGVLASAITPIAEAIAAVLLPILPQLSELFTTLIAAVAPLIQVLGEGLASVIQTLLPPILQLVIALADALMPIFEALIPVITPLLEIVFQLANTIGALLVPVIALLLPLIQALSPIFELLGLVLAPLLQLFSAILKPITTLITIIASLLTPIIQFLAEVIGAIINVALRPLTAAFEFLAGILAEHVIPWFEASVVVLQAFWENAIVPLIGWIRDLASNVSDRFGTIRDAVGSLGDFWDSTIGAMIDAVVDFVSDVGSSWSNLVGTLGDLGDSFGDIFGSIEDFVSDAASSISDSVSWIVDRVQSALDAVASIGNVDLNPFADGGIVNAPTRALIGEAGKEVVIPLTRPQRAAELAQQSGLIDLLAGRGVLGGGDASAGGAPMEMHVHSSVADPEQVARRAVRIWERRQAGRGLERVS